MAHEYTHSPDIYVMPIYDGMYAHKLGPARIGGIKMCQVLAMWICPTSTDKYGLYRRCVAEVICERSLHGFCILEQGEGVCSHTARNEFFNFCEGMWGLDVHALDGSGSIRVRSGAGQVFLVESAEIQYKKDEAVLAAVVCK